MSKPLPFDEIKFERNDCLEDVSDTPDDSDFVYLSCFKIS